jgi:transcriptional regulator with XRE-family HTH domain
MAIKILWGPLLKAQRKSHHLNQDEVANLLHITRQAYSNMECGRTQPTAEALAILSEIYDIDIYQYAVKNMPDEMVAEQSRFKVTMPNQKNKKKSKSIYF